MLVPPDPVVGLTPARAGGRWRLKARDLAVAPTLETSHTASAQPSESIDWRRALPFAALHLACVAVVWVGVSWIAIVTAIALYAIRMFALTAFYHRCFAHKAFRASRGVQFVFAALGATAAQQGPLGWVSHHRNHHRFADRELDPHSPAHNSLAWAHLGWFLTRGAARTDWSAIPDLGRYRELRLLDRFAFAMPVLLAAGVFALGHYLGAAHPELGTNGVQLFVWGFCVSTVGVLHATLGINSIAHRFGTRRFETRDESRNNLWLALATFGEGWHNNHHRFPGAARQGLRWWEIDFTYYGLRVLALIGVVRDLRPVPSGFAEASRGGMAAATKLEPER